MKYKLLDLISTNHYSMIVGGVLMLFILKPVDPAVAAAAAAAGKACIRLNFHDHRYKHQHSIQVENRSSKEKRCLLRSMFDFVCTDKGNQVERLGIS